ncbi:uncharacterized protein KD926_006754 [Aspergillus affinis]|uniref:uncharacterized protein n=1 Tax=Aspergillus affinis TaxID=1070780 RepID=UPI0022FEB838|nr:uncharacterized protein KD926_006754 [Aspergillus affinis]KAI9041516.1 hypothetical protein KD926_006754 [Aspergillus affinis]
MPGLLPCDSSYCSSLSAPRPTVSKRTSHDWAEMQSFPTPGFSRSVRIGISLVRFGFTGHDQVDGAGNCKSSGVYGIHGRIGRKTGHVKLLKSDERARMTTEELAVGLVPVDLRAPIHYDDGDYAQYYGVLPYGATSKRPMSFVYGFRSALLVEAQYHCGLTMLCLT